MKKVRDFMSHDVVYFSPRASVFEVAKVFSQKDISGAPVVENDKVVGIISISDIVRFMSMKLAKANIAQIPSLSLLLLNFVKSGKDFLLFKKEIERISKTEIRNMMSKKIISIHPDASLLEAACIMEKNDVNRLPVLENDKLVGIIARADLVKALVE
ncbi:MAG: CBS domain-containing protein [Candidatus Aenigmarchaeota archaeon]|nr:CBS domain-containing protein [Candidatus Aenigmarchaeota archaeon]